MVLIPLPSPLLRAGGEKALLGLWHEGLCRRNQGPRSVHPELLSRETVLLGSALIR